MLGDLEAKILYAVVHCGEDAYGVSIFDTIHERTGQNVAMGAIYATLDRIENKGFVNSRWSRPSPERGGRRKRLFEITAVGEIQLKRYDEQFRQMAQGWIPAEERR
jgi:PadR family transcriptional regulator, regulatory protein PadR